MPRGLAPLRLFLRHPLPSLVRCDDDLLHQVRRVMTMIMIMMITQDIIRPAITTFLSWLVLKEAFGIVEIGKEMLYLKASQILTYACLFLLSFNFCLQYTQRHLLLSSESPAHHFRNRVSCPAAIPVWDWQHTGDDNDNDDDNDSDDDTLPCSTPRT